VYLLDEFDFVDEFMKTAAQTYRFLHGYKVSTGYKASTSPVGRLSTDLAFADFTILYLFCK
jgi:hypothetical protein